MEQKREKFSSSLASFFATLSSAVGLGNIWMFPYVVGVNGGAAFIIIYLGCVLIIGLPTLISEFAIGRGARKNVFGAVNTVTDKKGFKAIGYIAVMATYCMLFFYTVVAGWVYAYAFKALTGGFKGITIEGSAELFYNTTLGPISPIVWQLIVLVVAGLILALGVKSGIEKLTKVLMPVLMILLVVCAIRSLTLPNSGLGIEFLFRPDFSKVTVGVILSALGLAFFKLSLGTGTMITYGSYFTEEDNLIKTGGKVAIADTGVSLLAGLAIFPAVFSFGLQPTDGPALLFNTVPLIFSKISGGSVLAILFFLLTAMAATMATISLVEVVIALFTEELKMSRKKAIIINVIIIISIGSLAALSANSDGLLGNVSIFGFSIFDGFDKLVSNFLLPLNGLLVILLLGYGVSKNFFMEAVTNNGKYKEGLIPKAFLFLIKYVTPILIIIVFIKTFI